MQLLWPLQRPLLSALRYLPVLVFLVVLLVCKTLDLSTVQAEAEGLILVGAASVDVTPEGPIRLSGYGNRSTPSEGVAQPLHAKALAIGGGDGPDAAPLSVLITVDAIGIPASITQQVREGLRQKTGDNSLNLALSATHTHAAPTVKGCIPYMFPGNLTAEEQKAIDAYARQLVAKLLNVGLEAIDKREPGRLAWKKGQLTFAGNRRLLEDGKWVGFGTQEGGPVDHSFPLMRVTNAKGELLALWMNYACHCTTLGGNFNQIHADWAGEARTEIEKRHPGTVALISIGCGADQNPNPRGDLEAVAQHGQAMANEVDRLLDQNLKPLTSAPTGEYRTIQLELETPPAREKWEARAKLGKHEGYFAQAMLDRLHSGQALETEFPYAIQTWTFGEDLAVVFLAGEVVVDYAERLYFELRADRLWLNAYSNDVPCYIVSRRLYPEGGYEVDRSMVYYGKPNRLKIDTEDKIIAEIHRQLPEFKAPF